MAATDVRGLVVIFASCPTLDYDSGRQIDYELSLLRNDLSLIVQIWGLINPT